MEPLGGASPQALNVVVTGKSVVERRPGICAAEGIASGVISGVPIESIFQAMSGEVFAFGGRTGTLGEERHALAQVRGEGSTTSWLSPASGVERQVFCEYDANVIGVASGGCLQRIRWGQEDHSAWSLERMTSGTALSIEQVPWSTHVTSMSMRLVANELRYGMNRVRYSGLPMGSLSYPNYDSWNEGIGTAGDFSAENAPDPIVAISRTREYLLVFGTRTVQFFAPDPTWVFSPTITLPVGCAAPYSIIDCEYWIDDRKRVVRLQGGDVASVSQAIQAELDAMTVSDAYGFRVELGAFSCLVWVFPTDGRTFVLQEGVGWGQWQGRSGDRTTRLDLNAHHRSQTTGLNLVGTRSGRLGKLSMAASTDFGEGIEASVTTGYQNHGTLKNKRCAAITLTLERGRSSVPSTAVVWYRDRPGPWSGRIPISLGGPGDTQSSLTFRSLGVYTQRQWKFEFLGSERLALVDAVEEFEVI